MKPMGLDVNQQKHLKCTGIVSNIPLLGALKHFIGFNVKTG